METTPATAASSASNRLPKTSLFASTTRSATTSTSLRGQHHNTSLFETPNLTPIVQEKSYAAATTNPRVVIRARKVAARLYYPPSPETPASGILLGKSLFLSGLQEQTTSPKEEEVNSNLGQTNSLFSANKKTTSFVPKQEQPQQRQQDMEEEQEDDATKRTDALNQEDEEGGGGGVQEILELLCVFGAAHRHLCQVRATHFHWCRVMCLFYIRNSLTYSLSFTPFRF